MKKKILLGILSGLCIAISGCGSTETKMGLPEDIAAQAITNDEVANRTCIVTPLESCDITGICYYDDENDKRYIYDTADIGILREALIEIQFTDEDRVPWYKSVDDYITVELIRFGREPIIFGCTPECIVFDGSYYVDNYIQDMLKDMKSELDTSKRTSILGEEEANRVREVFFWMGGEKYVIRDKEDILTFTDAILQVELDESKKIVHEVPIEGCVDIYMVLENGDMISLSTYGGKSVNFKGAEYPCETNFFELVMILAGEKRDTSWGLTLETKDVTPTGLTLVCSQSGCELEGQLQSGSWYELEQKTSSGWKEIEYLQSDMEIAWTDEVAILLIANTSKEWKVDWSWLYGELSPGTYRIKKSFDNLISPGNFEVHDFYAEFTIEE